MRIAILSLILSMSLTAVAANHACMFESSVQGEPIKDCMYFETLPEKDFKKSCEQIAKLGNALSKSTATVTYLEKCPDKYQGVCSKTNSNQKIKAYYYKRSAELLVKTKKSCEKTGGSWQN